MIVSSVVLLYIYKDVIYKYAVLYKFSKIEYGQLVILGNDNAIIFAKHNTQNLKVTIRVYNEPMFFYNVATKGEVGLGEMYTKGIWKTVDGSLLDFMEILVRNAHLLRRKKSFSETHTSAKKDAHEVSSHYDVGNDFYSTFLTDQFMAYTCAFWFSPEDSLEKAQLNKVRTIMRKLELKQGDTVLDVGCGWGKIGRYISENTGANVHGVTLSKEQAEYIRNNMLMKNVFLMHYTDLPYSNAYDKIYSIGMLEHVRCANYKMFFRKMETLLKPGGRLVLHTIVINPNSLDEASCRSCKDGESITFVTKHIFPGGQIPKYEWIINSATRQNNLKLVHAEGFGGHHYGKTLAAWKESLMQHREALLDMGYKEDTLRAYEYYFSICEANFMLGGLYICQFVFEKCETLYGR